MTPCHAESLGETCILDKGHKGKHDSGRWSWPNPPARWFPIINLLRRQNRLLKATRVENARLRHENACLKAQSDNDRDERIDAEARNRELVQQMAFLMDVREHEDGAWLFGSEPPG